MQGASRGHILVEMSKKRVAEQSLRPIPCKRKLFDRGEESFEKGI